MNKSKIIHERNKFKTLEIEAAPFGCSEHDVHPDVPGERADRADIAVKPLLQVAIIDVLIDKYPEITSSNR